VEEEANKHARDYITEKIEEYKLDKIMPFDNDRVVELIRKRIDRSINKNQPFSFEFSRTAENGDLIIDEKFNTIPENIVSYLVDFFVSTMPDLIADEPRLLLEYNEDGTRKTYSEIEAFKINIMSAPGIIINDVETEREDVLNLCNSIIESCPLLRVQKLEQQLNRDLSETVEEQKTDVFANGIANISAIIETENFYPANILSYIEKREIEINKIYPESIRNNYSFVFEEVKKQLLLKIPNLQSQKECADDLPENLRI
jgi:hypothetical protein